MIFDFIADLISSIGGWLIWAFSEGEIKIKKIN
jgi:hypothetical protein